MLTAESIKQMQNVNVKYVRLPQGFRYAVANGPLEHRDLVQTGETPLSAGFFSYSSKDKFFMLHRMGSVSLQLDPLAEDAELLKTIFLT